MPLLLLATALLVAGAQASDQPRVNRDARILKDFTGRVEQYIELHKKLERTLPPLKEEATAEEIHAHQVALARLIREARGSARPGDMFTPEARGLLRRLIYRVLNGPDGQAVRRALFDEDTAAVELRVNGPYPSSVPLSTVPAPLLLGLPRLPEEVEYRFVGRRLILFDVHAQLIVDFIKDAVR